MIALIRENQEITIHLGTGESMQKIDLPPGVGHSHGDTLTK
ncbi:MAG: hypothetical protein NTZ00_05570 [Bacteroidetes bacterium]|nr:hypothetical protein [Bacteroidota bacterium]